MNNKNNSNGCLNVFLLILAIPITIIVFLIVGFLIFSGVAALFNHLITSSLGGDIFATMGIILFIICALGGGGGCLIMIFKK